MVQPTENPEGEHRAAADSDATIVVQEKGSLPTIPGYQVTRHIGAGGMAHVWLAIDDNLKRQVALKTMSLDLSADASFDKRFAEEAQIVAGFRHNNIVMVFARGHTGDHHYIAMEYVSGGTLTDLLARGVVPPTQAKSTALAMADALAYSHANDIIHRDFKPGNILFTEDGTPVLSDFGIAKSTDPGNTDLTVPGVIIGSPKYMAPEQKLGLLLTSKVDVYALGLVFFEMLVGAVPPSDIAIVKGDAQADALAELLPSGCEDVAGIIADCLHDDPNLRPTAAEAAGLLRALLQPKAARSLGAKILAAVGVAGLAAAVLFNLYGNPEYDVDFQVTPTTASLYVDGQRLVGTTTSLVPGVHQILVVEQDHYGQILNFDAVADIELPVTLESIDLPTFEQFETFTGLFSEDALLEDIAAAEMDYLPFQQLLKLKEHQIAGETSEIAEIVSKLNALANVGDPAAQLMLFIANFDEVISGDQFDFLIQQASNSGYGLATFYQALHYRWLHTRDGDDQFDSISSLQVYRDFMATARDQGLEFADMLVKDADSLLQ